MAERVDLDAAQARFDKAAAHRFSGPSRYTNEHVADLAASAGDVPRLVAELLAARRVVDLLPDWAALNLAANKSGDDKLRRQLYDTGNALAEYRRTYGAGP